MNAKDRKLVYERIYPWMKRFGFSLYAEKSKEWRATARYIFYEKVGNIRHTFEFFLMYGLA